MLALSFAARCPAEIMGHWTFDEGAGFIVGDSSGKGNNGTLMNDKAMTWTNGYSGAGLYFDGTVGAGATYVSIVDAASLHLSTQGSFAAWVRWEDTGRDSPILAKEGDGALSYWFGAFGPAHFGVLLDTDGNQPWAILDRDQGQVPQGQWTHLASTWDGTTVRHYLNGVLLNENASFPGPVFGGSGPLIIGANFPYNSTAFKGALDEVRLYNHALSGAEIRAIAGVTTEMVGYWPLDEGSGILVADRSGRGNHGTLIHPRPFTWTNGVIGSGLYFDGTTGVESTYVEIPDSPSLRMAGSISFAAWVRCEDIQRDAPVLAKEGDGKLSYWFGAFGVATEGAGPGNFGILLDLEGSHPWTMTDRNQGMLPLGEWAHIASTWDGATIRHYLNGEPLAETAAFTGPIYVSDAFLAIGANSLLNFTAFKGAIDEVRIYSYGLSAEEIRAIYLAAGFRITAVSREGEDLRIEWACQPGWSYVVQTNQPAGTGGITEVFGDLSAPIIVPEGSGTRVTNFVHAAALRLGQGIYYRVKQLP